MSGDYDDILAKNTQSNQGSQGDYDDILAKNTQQPIQVPNAPTTIVQGMNRSGLPPVDVNSPEGQARLSAWQNAQQYFGSIGGTQQSPADIQRGQYLALHPELQGDNSGVNPAAVGYQATPANFGKAAVNVGSWVIPGEAEYRVATSALPLLSKPLVTGLIGAGGEALREGINNGSVNPIPVIASGVTSGLGGLIGGHLSSKAAANEAQYLADKANMDEKIIPQWKILNDVWEGNTPPNMQVLSDRGNNELVIPNTSKFYKKAGEALPSDKIQAAKNYMASVEQGNRIPPSSISDLEASNWINEQKENFGSLLNENSGITKAPLFVNQFNRASPRTVTELLKQNSINSALNGLTNFGNRYQKQIGIASGLLPSLGGPVGEYADYRFNKQ